VDTHAIHYALCLALLALDLVIFQLAVLADAGATAVLALISDLTVGAKAAAPALFALVFQLSVRANAVAPALFALAPHPSMLTHALAIAFLALILDSQMLAKCTPAATHAFLTLISQSVMVANASSTTLLAAVLGFAVRAQWLLRSHETVCRQRTRRWLSFEQSKQQCNYGKQKRKKEHTFVRELRCTAQGR
jgi:hypothetical protein